MLSILANCYFLIKTINTPSSEKIFANNISRVVEIKTSLDNEVWGYATGCFIRENKILTNKHVVYNEDEQKNYNYIFVRLASNNEYQPAKIIEISGDSDLALLEVEFHNKNHYSLARNIQEGEEVYTIGNPNGFGLSFSKGVVASNYRKVINKNISITALQLSIVINEGNSGGPVFNKEGELVGLISFRLKDKFGEVIQGIAFAVPFENIQSFLKTIK